MPGTSVPVEMMCTEMAATGENCSGKIAVVRSGDQLEQPDAVLQLDDVLVWTSPPRPECPCMASVKARQLEAAPELEMRSGLDTGLLGVDLDKCWESMGELWAKALQDPADRVGLADKVESEAWQLRKLMQNVDQLTESLNEGGSQE